MKLLDSHIRNTVLLSMLVVISLIAALDLLLTLADQLGDTDENFSMFDALTFVLYTTPTSIYELLPFSALGGALIGLGVLASNNELVVMQAAGVKIWRIVWAVLKPTLFIMVLSLLLGEFVSPPLEQIARSNKAIQRSGNEAINTEQGSWRKIGNEYIHINAIASGGEQLYGITRYQLDADRRIVATSFAASANYIEDDESSYWQLNNVDASLLAADSISVQHYLQEDWQVVLSPEILSMLLVRPDRQSISGLYRFARFFDTERLESSTYYLAFWNKLLQPVATLALVILAISFVFGSLREATMGYRVFVAMGIGLVFTILQRLMEPASLLFGISPFLAVLIPILICGGLGLFFLQRTR